ncbi:MAG: NUDIX domain-containing protein [Bacteroidales bacterium]
MHLTGKSFKVFVDNKALHFSPEAPRPAHGMIEDLRQQDSPELWQLFSQWLEAPHSSDLTLLTTNPAKLLRSFAINFMPVEAAGGLVKNSAGKLLVIYRWQKWDLPKGKLDPGELPPQAATREVTEECGINNLTITATLPYTLHAYPLKNGQWALKQTHWFAMTTRDTSPLVPQQQEGIEKAIWIGQEELPMVISNTYASLRELFHLAFK